MALLTAGKLFRMTPSLLVLSSLIGWLCCTACAAPVPLRSGDEKIGGRLQFKSRKPDFRGTDAGQVNDLRLYIAGHPQSPQRAIWTFENFPTTLLSALDGRQRSFFHKLRGERRDGTAVQPASRPFSQCEKEPAFNTFATQRFVSSAFDRDKM